MVSPSPATPTGPLETSGKQSAANHFLRTYGFQLFALLLGIALAFM